MNKRTPVPGYRLLPSPSTKLKLKDNHYDTPCMKVARSSLNPFKKNVIHAQIAQRYRSV